MKNLVLDTSFWSSFWRKISSSENGLDFRDELIARYSETHRAYHTTQHLNECLNLFKSYQALAENPEAVFLALWYHDAIYATTSNNDNEQASANLASRDLKNINTSPKIVSKIEDLILITKHSSKPITPDQKLIVDIDLAILGATNQRFLEYESQIRAEYCFVPDFIFKTKRNSILKNFLDRPTIYNTPDFVANLENQARSNLTKAIARYIIISHSASSA